MAEHSPTEKVTLVGHSAGGVLSRLYLSDEPFRGKIYAGIERVSTLITLGSPHHNPKRAHMRRRVEDELPGAFYAPRVRYVSVAGRAIAGDREGTRRERLSGWLYGHLCGRRDVWGDGLVPVGNALLGGADHVILPGVLHAPLFGKPWYGSPEIVEQWC
jgi:pimeloyl-ACP methyl ester carboxylesterase